MPGYGYGYGYGVKAPSGGGAPTPPLADLYSWIDIQNSTPFDSSGDDYVDFYTSAGGDYGGIWDHTDAGNSANKWDGTTQNGLAISKIHKPTGGNAPYEQAARSGPWTEASFGLAFYQETGQNNPIYLTGDDTYWSNAFYKNQNRRCGVRLGGTFYDTSAVGSWEFDAWNIVIYRYRKTGSPSIQVYLNGADITTTTHNNINKDYYIRKVFVTEDSSGNDCRLGDACIYDAFISLDTVNDLGIFLSNKYGLGQTWELS